MRIAKAGFPLLLVVRPTNKVQTESRPSENSWQRGGHRRQSSCSSATGRLQSVSEGRKRQAPIRAEAFMWRSNSWRRKTTRFPRV